MCIQPISTAYPLFIHCVSTLYPLRIQSISTAYPLYLHCVSTLYALRIHCLELPMEPRMITRWDVHKYARRAYEMGVRYIGGCCGFHPYHIRAIAEELAPERGRFPPASDKHSPWGEALKHHSVAEVRARANRAYWEDLKPASGRPFCPSLSVPEGGLGPD
ncbi:hypothetical protein ACROYT_G034781 [Oculina patagonica]